MTETFFQQPQIRQRTFEVFIFNPQKSIPSFFQFIFFFSFSWFEIAISGMGLLGLHCLLYVASCYPDRTQQIIAKHEQRGDSSQGTFPWACAGINVCAMLYDLFQVFLRKKTFFLMIL